MSRLLVDTHETNAFQQVAKEMGYEPNQFIPGGRAEAVAGTIENTVHIGRRGKSKVYKNVPGWSALAIADLKSGFGGPPL